MFAFKRMNQLVEKSYSFFIALFSAVLLFPNEFSNIALIGLIVTFLITSFYHPDRLKTNLNNGIYLTMGILLLVQVLSILYSSDLPFALKKIQTQLPLIVFPLLFIHNNYSERQLKKFFIIGVTITILITVIIATHKSNFIYKTRDWENNYKLFMLEYTYQRFAARFGNHALYLGIFVTTSTLFCFEKLKSSKWFKTLLLIIFFNSIIILLLKTATVSLSYFVAIVIGVLCNTNLNKNRNKIILSILSAALLCLVIFFVLIKFRVYYGKTDLVKHYKLFSIAFVGLAIISYFVLALRDLIFTKKMVSALSILLAVSLIGAIFYAKTNTNYLNYKENYSNANARIGNWYNSLQVIRTNPVMGVGIGDSQSLLLKEYKKDNWEVGMKAQYNEHNQFLRYWSTSGIMGLLAFSFLLILPTILAIREKDWYLLGIMFSFLFFSFTESWTIRQKGIYLFCYLLTIYGIQYREFLSLRALKNSMSK